MSWISLKLEADACQTDQMSDSLIELGALSVSIEDANAETPDEQPIFGEPGDPPPGLWSQSRISALFENSVVIEDVITELCSAFDIVNLKYSIEHIEEKDWVRSTQSQFDPIRITDNFWIVPTWHTAPDPEAINIVLDPGLAFGTGSHPTTHLCLSWLIDNVKQNLTILDYGCGSGILAIAAKKLGASKVVGVDIDTQAIQASIFNAEQNHVEADFYTVDNYSLIPSDLVVANILSSALMVLAPMLAQACKKDGRIALSGILPEQAEQVSGKYSEWFIMDKPTYLDSWVLLTGSRK